MLHRSWLEDKAWNVSNKRQRFLRRKRSSAEYPYLQQTEASVFCATVGTNFAFLKSEGNHMHKVYTLRTCFLIHVWLYS